ncbi:DUF397 domain-containing protein [Streptomyces sp. DH41]|uniref:DUF397 domain-containing protein n=1 Tax=Streptomyces sp. DH41 TaxID=3040125 RepID=UPI002442D69D|nr:DUF397 domain-containing protein [Streptomyces sp. DH41]MDG9721554.1 DUF397 domain-containing protein [Streptomyces sp. DH41]
MPEPLIPNAADLVGWRKSTHSGNEAGSCLEIVDDHPAGIPVRDSKVPDGGVLVFSAVGWSSFITALKGPPSP